MIALEPEAQNCAVLNQNIMVNGLTKTMSAYCVAVSDGFSVDHLNLSSFSAGSALHGYGEAVTTVDAHAPGFQKFDPVHIQGCIAFSIDELVAAGLPAPTQIKIDVDGLEDKVVKGAHKTLEEGSVVSLLIETNKNMESHLGFVAYLEGLGYTVDDKNAINFIFRR